MKKIVYTRTDGGVSVITPASKEALEKVLGSLTEAQYDAHVRERSIPTGATNVRDIDASDLPTREFRNAWCDITAESKIDISAEKAIELKLTELRMLRDTELTKTDMLMTRALEEGDMSTKATLMLKRTALRDVTEPLKALTHTGAATEAMLAEIRSLSTLTGV